MNNIVILLDENGKYESTEVIVHLGRELVKYTHCPRCFHEKEIIYKYTRAVQAPDVPPVWLAKKV